MNDLVVSGHCNFFLCFLGILTHAFQTIYVSRLDADSRQQCSKEIERRAHSGGLWPPVLIFPEGKLVHLSSHFIIHFDCGWSEMLCYDVMGCFC